MCLRCICSCLLYRFASGEFNWGPNYGTGGYVVNLDLDPDKAMATLQQLMDDRCVSMCVCVWC